MKIHADQEILFFHGGVRRGDWRGGDVVIDNFTILIITVIYRWVNNRVIYKFVKNNAQTKENMFATMPNTVNLQRVPTLPVYLQNIFCHHTRRQWLVTAEMKDRFLFKYSGQTTSFPESISSLQPREA